MEGKGRDVEAEMVGMLNPIPEEDGGTGSEKVRKTSMTSDRIRKTSRTSENSERIRKTSRTSENSDRVRKTSSRSSIVFSRSVSIESSNGRKLIKNIQRSVDIPDPIVDNNKVPLFRLNSVLSDVGIKEEGEEPERQEWDSPVEFLLSCISMSVGLGNVWRFPFTAYENGGGAFLIPYLLVLFFVGRPLYFLELGLGQFSSSGSVRMWDMVPAFGGIGYGQVIATGCVATYFCSLIGLSIYYLGMSFYPTLPWTKCSDLLGDPETQICIPSGENKSDFVSCYGSNETSLNYSICVKNDVKPEDITENTTGLTVMSSAQQFFTFGVLKAKDDISDGLGLPDPPLAGCLAVCWLLIYLSLRRGVSSSGKVAYFTAIFPYLVLLVMLIKGLTLPGAVDGIKFFFTPEWKKLGDLDVWYAAVTQSFFSLGIGFGTLTSYASFNKFRHNTSRDAFIISIADTGTSILAGTVIFSILGHFSHQLGVEIEEVVKLSPPGLAFVTYPEVLAKFDFAPQFFAILFFLMLVTLGLGSAIGCFSAVTTTMCDSFPNTNRKFVIKICCFSGFALGLFYVTPGGMTMLELVDYFAGTLLIIALASLEVIGINWIYGTNLITRDFNFMLDENLSIYWRFCWGILCPLLLPFLFLYAMVTQAGMPPSLTPTGQVFGWTIAVLGIMIVPVHFILSITADQKGEFLQRVISVVRSGLISQKVKEAFRPNPSWGPSNIEERTKWEEFKRTVGSYDWLPTIIKAKLGIKN